MAIAAAKVGLPATGHAGQHQPALWLLREATRALHDVGVARLRLRTGGAAFRQQRLEAKALERAEPRVAQQPRVARARVLARDAIARHGATEVGVRGIVGDADEARALAARTVRLARNRGERVSDG